VRKTYREYEIDINMLVINSWIREFIFLVRRPGSQSSRAVSISCLFFHQSRSWWRNVKLSDADYT